MHTAIYVPSYFDFIRIRNYMDENDYSYHVLSEYVLYIIYYNYHLCIIKLLIIIFYYILIHI